MACKNYLFALSIVVVLACGNLRAAHPLGAIQSTQILEPGRGGQPGKPVVMTAVAISSGGKLIATGGDDHMVRIWNTANGGLIHKLEGHLDWVRSLAFNPEGTILVSAGDDRRIIFWDVSTGKASRTLPAHGGAIYSLAWSSDARMLAAAGFESGVRLYRPDGELLRTLSGPCNDLRAVAFSPNCQRVAAAGRNGQLIVWDTESGNVALEITAGAARIRTLAYSPEGDQILSAGDGRFLCAWDAQSGAPLHKIPAKGAKVLALTFCTPQIVATAGSDNLVHVWDWTTQSEKFQLYGHTGTVAALACDPQTATLVSGSYDTTVRVWKLDAPASPRMAQPPRESAPVR